MTYFLCLQPAEKLPMTANIRSEFSDCQWYQWQPMVPLVKLPVVPLVKLQTYPLFGFVKDEEDGQEYGK